MEAKEENVGLSNANFEEQYVADVYKSISHHFNSTRRQHKWLLVRNFLDSLDFGSTVIDVGCGNGKYLDFPNLHMFGFDLTEDLLFHAQKLGASAHKANCLSVPVRQNHFCAAICIAVIHHLSSVENRIQALTQIARALAPGGRACLCCWAFENNPKRIKGEKNGNWRPIPPSEGGCPGDYYVDWHLDERYTKHRVKEAQELPHKGRERVRFTRYYHLFIENELKELCSHVEDIDQDSVEEVFDQDNWYLYFSKQK
ncbi:hypothetical protein PCE1_000107 [Barthelona sp. PCE]